MDDRKGPGEGVIRTIIHPSGAVLDLPEDTLTTCAYQSLDGMVGLAVEIRRYARDGARVENMAGVWDEEFTIEYPTTKRARLDADEAALERYGDPHGGLDLTDRRGGLEGLLSRQSLGESCLVHLGERDGYGRRLWRLARREIPRALLDEAEQLLFAVNLPAARENFDEAMTQIGVLGYGLRRAIVQVERAGLDASGFIALRARCHELVGHNHGA